MVAGRVRFSLAVCFLVFWGTSSAGTDQPDRSEIDLLIQQLGSSKFSEREAASQRLEALGRSALDALRRAARSEDPEVRRRGEALIGALKQITRCITLSGHGSAIRCIAFSPDSNGLVAAGEGGKVVLWRMSPGTATLVWEAQACRIYSMAFSNGGKTIAFASGRRFIVLWRAADGRHESDLDRCRVCAVPD